MVKDTPRQLLIKEMNDLQTKLNKTVTKSGSAAQIQEKIKKLKNELGQREIVQEMQGGSGSGGGGSSSRTQTAPSYVPSATHSRPIPLPLDPSRIGALAPIITPEAQERARRLAERARIEYKPRLDKETAIAGMSKEEKAYFDGLETKQSKVDKLKAELFANSVVRQKKNIDGVMVEDEPYIENLSQSRINTSIGVNMTGSARRNKAGEWTNAQLKKYMIPIRV